MRILDLAVNQVDKFRGEAVNDKLSPVVTQIHQMIKEFIHLPVGEAQFLLIGLAWSYIMPFWKGLNRHLALISIISGALLIIVGILMLTGQLTWLSRFAT